MGLSEYIRGTEQRIRNGIREANEWVLLWTFLALVGVLTTDLFITITAIAILYTAYSTLHALDYQPSPLYPALAFTLVIFLQDNAAALLLITALYVAEIAFNLLYKVTLKPFYSSFPIGFELVLFNTVLVGHSYGSTAGAIAGVLFGATYYGIIFGFNSTYQFINIPAYAIVGILAGTLSASFATTGIMLAIMYAVTTSTIITVLHGGRLYKTCVFLLTNISFNYWLFTSVTFI